MSHKILLHLYTTVSCGDVSASAIFKERYDNEDSWDVFEDDVAMPTRRRRVGNTEFNDCTSSQGFLEDDSSSTINQQELYPMRMTSRDRTVEFSNVVRSLQSSTARPVVASIRHGSQVSQQARHLQGYSDFMHIAHKIGKDLANTYAKLEKLALRKSFF